MFPKYTSARSCKFCGRLFKEGYCLTCKEYTEEITSRFNCRSCENAYSRARNDIRVAEANTRRAFYRDLFKQWCATIRLIPYKALTEDQWLKACSHFNGCAWCGSDSIDARTMFVSPDDGGMYTAWNIIPTCTMCAMSIKAKKDPISTAKFYGGDDKPLESLVVIMDYLEEAIKNEVQDIQVPSLPLRDKRRVVERCD